MKKLKTTFNPLNDIYPLVLGKVGMESIEEAPLAIIHRS